MTAQAEETRTLVIEKLFPHPPEKLWRALTEKALIAQWLLQNDFEPVVGHKFQFRRDPVPNWNGIIDCEVLTIDPFKRLSYVWSSMGVDTVVLFILTPTEGGTHLRIEHSGFRPDNPQAFGGAKYGWQNFLNRLDSVLGEQQ
jgi:uncharacterized protein YndB with AHSA1/START domain